MWVMVMPAMALKASNKAPVRPRANGAAILTRCAVRGIETSGGAVSGVLHDQVQAQRSVLCRRGQISQHEIGGEQAGRGAEA